MKKFDLKKAIILMLALVLVFALVACDSGNDKQDKPENPGPVVDTDSIDTVEFFETLWDSSKSLGSTAIAEDDNLAVDLDMSLSIMTKASKGDAIKSSINVGINAALVLDRKNDGNHSALKVRLYDATEGTNWFTAYYFIDDPYYIYIDYSGQKIKLGFDTNSNASYAAKLNELLNEDLNDKGLTLESIINALVKNTGENWTINDTITNLLTTFGVNLKSFLTENSIGTSVLGILNLDVDTIVNEQGAVQLDKIITNKTVLGLLFAKSTGIDDANDSARKIYNTNVSFNTIKTFLGSKFEPIIKGNSLPTVSLSYGVKNKQIDGFSIYLGLKNNALRGEYPAIELTIKDITLAKENELSTQNAAATRLGIAVADLAQFKEQFTIDTEIMLENVNVTINPTGSDSLKLDGTYKLAVKACIDLKNKQDNKTEIYATFAKVDNQVESNVIELNFSKGNLNISFDNTVKTVNDVSIVKAIVESLGPVANKEIYKLADKTKDDAKKQKIINLNRQLEAKLYNDVANKDFSYNTNFKGLSIQGVDVVEIFQNLFADKETNDVKTGPLSGTVVFEDFYKLGENEEYYSSDTSYYGVAPKVFGAKGIIAKAIEIIKCSSSDGISTISAKQGNFATAALYMLTTTTITPFSSLTKNENDNETRGNEYCYILAEKGEYVKVDDKYIKYDKKNTAHSSLSRYDIKTVTTAKIENESDLLARIFMYNTSSIDYFSSLGIIDYYTYENKEYLKNANMLTKEEINLMWDYAIGKNTYNDYVKAMEKAGKECKNEEDFNKYISSIAPKLVADFMKGSAFVSNSKDAITTLADSTVEVNLSFGTSIAAMAKVTCDTTSVALSVSVKASAYNADDYKAVIIPEKDADYLIFSFA